MKHIISENGFDFMGKRKFAIALSIILVIISLGSLLTRGLELGIDFTGGTLIEVGYREAAELGGIRDLLAEADFAEAQVQHFGSSRDVLIRVAPREDEENAQISERILATLRTQSTDVDMRRVEFVGPQVGGELIEKGGLAMLYAIGGILIYISLRFQWRFSVGAVVALVHDVIITLGVFSVIGVEFDLTVLAAILAVIGYSLNDTIVVFDRIRENFRKIRKGTPEMVMNVSINQTLSRTIITSLTTILVLLSLFFLGGSIIHSFAFALLIGVLVGTYSSIFVASVTTLLLGVSKIDLMPVEKEGAELDDTP